MTPPPTIGEDPLERLVQTRILWFEEFQARRPDELPKLRRRARDILERAIYELAQRVRWQHPNRDEFAAYLHEIRVNSLRAVADTIGDRRPEFKHLLHLITDPVRPRA